MQLFLKVSKIVFTFKFGINLYTLNEETKTCSFLNKNLPTFES